jgi:hypothetical protein
MIAAAIDGLPPQAAVKRLHGALRQLHGELSDALAAPVVSTRPVEIAVPAAEVRQALQPLFEVARG